MPSLGAHTRCPHYVPPSAWCQVLCTKYLVPNTWYQALGTKYLVPSTSYQLLGTKYLVPSTWYLGTRYLVPSTWYQEPGTNYDYCPFPDFTSWPGPNHYFRRFYVFASKDRLNMIELIRKFHFTSAGWGFGSCWLQKWWDTWTMIRRILAFQEPFWHSQNPGTLAGSVPGGSPDFWKLGNS